MGLLEKMKIEAYDDGEFKTKGSKETTVQINPEKYEHNSSIEYSEGCSIGASSKAPKFNKYGEDTVKFELVFDGTGVVSVIDLVKYDVNKRIEELKGVVYDFNSTTHQPNFVKLIWGKFIFQGRLKELKTTYTLFKPNGSPLRAKVNVTFSGYISADDQASMENRNSPDMTHIITVKEGDTLPLLCHRIYKSSLYYLKVAEVNHITNPRHLTPGDRLIFPPIKS